MNTMRIIFCYVFSICLYSFAKSQSLYNAKTKTPEQLIQSHQSVSKSVPVSLISSNYAEFHYGFICKKELLLDKQIKLPLRIRIGNLSYCNYLEGKQSHLLINQ